MKNYIVQMTTNSINITILLLIINKKNCLFVWFMKSKTSNFKYTVRLLLKAVTGSFYGCYIV